MRVLCIVLNASTVEIMVHIFSCQVSSDCYPFVVTEDCKDRKDGQIRAIFEDLSKTGLAPILPLLWLSRLRRPTNR